MGRARSASASCFPTRWDCLTFRPIWNGRVQARECTVGSSLTNPYRPGRPGNWGKTLWRALESVRALIGSFRVKIFTRVLILTDRTDHCDRLESMLLGKVPLATLHGVVAKKREALFLDQFQQRKVRVLIATRKRLGEGWDCPPLSTLILAMPINGRGSDLKQMIGRLTRIDPDKENPQFFDYRDAQVAQFQSMFRGRVKVYQKTLRGDQLPPDLRLERPPKKGKATLDYGPGPPDKGAAKVRERPVSGTEQLRLF